MFGNYPPPFGGIPTHLMYLSPYLVDAGWQVHIIPNKVRELGLRRVGDSIFVHRPTPRERALALFRRRLRVPGFAAWRHLYPSLRERLAAESRLRCMKKVCLENDIRLISAYHVFDAATWGAMLCEDLGLPMITTIFGDIYSHAPTFMAKSDQVNHVARHTREWYSCSDHCARSMEILGLPIKVGTLHYGIDTAHFTPDKDGAEIRARFGIPAGDRLVIFVGRMKNEMGLGILMQTMTLVLAARRDIHFLVVGSRGELTDAVRALSALHPQHIHVAKDQPYDSLPQCYAAATLAVVPSVNARACLGLAIIEALASSRAVIGCDVGGTREVLVDGEMGRIVRPSDPYALRDAILELIDDGPRLAAMGRRGREHAVKFFDKNITNRHMLDIIERVLAAATRA